MHVAHRTSHADGSLHRVSPFITTTRETAVAAAEMLNLGAFDTVADLGCGTGAALNVMCAHVAGARALGLDNCAELIVTARANALEMHVGDRACYELVDFLAVDAVALCARITKGTTTCFIDSRVNLVRLNRVPCTISSTSPALAVYMYICEPQLCEPRMKALLLAIARARIPIVSYLFRVAYLEGVCQVTHDDKFPLTLYRAGDLV